MTTLASMTSKVFEISFRMFELPFVMSAAFIDALLSDRNEHLDRRARLPLQKVLREELSHGRKTASRSVRVA